MTNRISQGQEQPSVSWSRITPTAVRQTFFGTAKILRRHYLFPRRTAAQYHRHGRP